MNLTKLTFPGIDLWVDLNDVTYMEREKRPDTLLVLANEKDYYTKLLLKSGKTIAVVETPDYILGKMKDMIVPSKYGCSGSCS
jgi:hypothetical protein